MITDTGIFLYSGVFFDYLITCFIVKINLVKNFKIKSKNTLVKK